jgi:peptide/nickel transport system ATP-binding protein
VEREVVLRIEDLRVVFKVFRGELKVVDGIMLAAHSGERLGLVGESGCGKTTCGRCVVRLVQPTSGKILFSSKRLGGNIDIANPDGKQWYEAKREIQMIFQNPGAALNPVFTIGTQFITALRYAQSNNMKNREIRRRAIEALREVQLPDPKRILKSYPFQLSGGMNQRISIAMALAVEPVLLIADEPTTALDVTVQNQILELFYALVRRKETSLIYITHNLGVIREIADTVYVMYAGTIVEHGNPREIFSNPLHPYTQGLVEAIPKLAGGGFSKGIRGSIPSYLEPPSGCRFHPRCPKQMQVCKEERPSFIKVSEDQDVACFLLQENDDRPNPAS